MSMQVLDRAVHQLENQWNSLKKNLSIEKKSESSFS
jgi:hypothetical protein